MDKRQQTTRADYDPVMVQRALQLMHTPGDIIEVRMIDVGPLRTVSGYFNDLPQLIKAVDAYAHRPDVEAVYVTLNRINPALLARSANTLKAYTKTTTSDTDVQRRILLGLDFDPKRPAKISSSDDEHVAALHQAQRCATWLSAMGWPAPLRGDSGNGGHLLYRIDLPNSDPAKDLIVRVLQAIDCYHGTDTILVDQTVFNAARIWKLFGTMTRKGSHIPERPHRMARILEAPDVLTVVTREQLQHVADMVPVIEASTPKSHGTGKSRILDVQAWLQRYGLEVKRDKPWKGGTLYELKVCPWNPEHIDGVAYVIQQPSGAIGAACFHNGCHGKGWPELREQYEPRATRPATSHATEPKADRTTHRPHVEAIHDLDDEDAVAEREAIQQERPLHHEYPCPENLWIGVHAEVAKRLNKKSWEIWTGTTAALAAVAERQIDVRYYGSLYGMGYFLLVKPTGLGKGQCTNTCKALLPESYTVRDAVQSGPALAPILAEIERDKKDRVIMVRSRPAILIVEEWTGLIRNMGIANSTLLDTINLLFHRKYPWNVSRSDRAGAGGDLVIPRPTMTICGTTTASMLKHCVSETMIRSGFLNRHLILPGSNGGWTFHEESEQAAGINFDSLTGLLEPFRHHAWPNNEKDNVWLSYDKEARKRMSAWGQETFEPIMNSDSLDAEAMKRLHVYAHILSVLYAWSEKCLKIEMKHVEATISVINVAKSFLEQLMGEPEEVEPPPFKRYEIAIEQKILTLVREQPGLTRREVVRKLMGRSIKSADVNTAINQLAEIGRLHQKEGGTTERGGRKPLRLYVTKDE
jgi:hypothetical protein